MSSLVAFVAAPGCYVRDIVKGAKTYLIAKRNYHTHVMSRLADKINRSMTCSSFAHRTKVEISLLLVLGCDRQSTNDALYVESNPRLHTSTKTHIHSPNVLAVEFVAGVFYQITKSKILRLNIKQPSNTHTHTIVLTDAHTHEA